MILNSDNQPRMLGELDSGIYKYVSQAKQRFIIGVRETSDLGIYAIHVLWNPLGNPRNPTHRAVEILVRDNWDESVTRNPAVAIVAAGYGDMAVQSYALYLGAQNAAMELAKQLEEHLVQCQKELEWFPSLERCVR